MRVTFAAAVAALLALSTGCPKGSSTKPTDPGPTDPKPVVTPPVDAGVPVVEKKPLPAYKPKYTRPKPRLYTSGGIPWFRSRRRVPRLRGLPHTPVELPPTKLIAEAAARKALAKAKPASQDRFRLESVLAYHAYQRAASTHRQLERIERQAKAASNWRARYRLRRQLRVARRTLRAQLKQARDKYDALVKTKNVKDEAALLRARYQAALVLQLGRTGVAAREAFGNLIAKHPKTEAAGAAHVALAELYFERGNFGAARRHYEQVSSAPALKLKPDLWRDLRRVWTLARTRDGKRAWTELLKLPRGRFIRGLSGNQARLFRSTVRRIAPWVYASGGEATSAIREMKKVDYRKPWSLVRELAEIYAYQRRRSHAVDVYKLLLARLPKDPDACLWRFHAVANQLIGDPTAKTIKALRDVIDMYKKANAARLLPSEGQRNCEREVKTVHRNIARRLHRRARAKPSSSTWAAAETLYKLYLDTFAPAPQVHADYAELTWRRAELEKDPKRAFELWQAAAKRFVILSHRNAWKRLQDKAKKAAAQAWGNAAAIVETGYVDGKTRKDAAALFAESCKVGRLAGFTEGCENAKRLEQPASTTPPPAPTKPAAPPTTPPR